MSYDAHGYAYDINITTDTLENLQILIKKLRLYSKNTGLELETTKCKATGALWERGNPLRKANAYLLKCKIDTIKFKDVTSIRYLSPNKSINLEYISAPC
jgi:hypothetical protein